MPFETVNEQVYRQRRVLVCERCRKQMPGVVQNRSAYQTGGSIAGSLGGSVGGSMLAGAVLGPVGALAGAIGGAIAGSRAGAVATDGVCDAVESTASSLCDECKAARNVKPSGQRDWGGGRLGDSTGSAAPAAPASVNQQPGEGISGVAAAAGERISEVASAAGEQLSGAASWLRRSVSSVVGGSSDTQQQESRPSVSSSTGQKAFKAFEGGGYTLGSASAPPRAPAPTSQLEEDEQLARQLQEQFLLEDQQHQR